MANRAEARSMTEDVEMEQLAEKEADALLEEKGEPTSAEDNQPENEISAIEFQQLKKIAEVNEEPDPADLIPAPELVFDPELVFSIDYLADAGGWAHSLQVHPDGSADYVAHRPEQLKVGVRWICRTPDQDAMGLVLPATAEPEGYHAEKAKGNIVVLPGESTFHLDLRIGTLSAEEAKGVETKIEEILGG